jgi:hypothetical protein
MTTPPPEDSTPIVTPTPEETRAINNAFSDEEILALAKQIQESGALGFEPVTLVKGTITAVANTGSPPTVTINISGDTTTPVGQVRLMNNYSPVVGHTVIIAKMGPDIVVLGHIADLAANVATNGAGGWIKADISNGTHNADSQGDVFYRRILDHGSWKMQWQGGWGVSGTFVIDTAKALPAEYRPRVKRPVTAARQFSTGAIACHAVFHTDGRVEIQGMTQAINTASVSGDVGFSSGGGTSVTDTSHNHADWEGFATFTTFMSHSHSDGGHDHSFFGGGHTHPVTAPSWVSFNGLEYFL